MLKNIIANVEAQMNSRIAELRDRFQHAGNKGSVAEMEFRSFLREYLPRRYEIGHGEIVDLNGLHSKQTDIVIVGEEHPFTFSPEQAGIFFIEGVRAVGEVKLRLTSKDLSTSLSAYKTFCDLKILQTPTMWQSPSNYQGDFSKKLPPWFLFAFESQLNISTINDKIREYSSENFKNSEEMSAGIFILDKGHIINYEGEKGFYQRKSPEGELLTGWISHKSSTVLPDLLIWLSTVICNVDYQYSILTEYIADNPFDS